MSEIAIRFTVELVEDLHAGTGVGRLGLIDDTQGRDQRMQPVVWASALRGLLREAGEDYLASLRQVDVPNAEVDRITRLMHRAIGRTSAEENGSEQGLAMVRALRCMDEKTRPAEQCLVWSSTAREPNSRRPLEGTLRQIEFARSGLRLQGEIRLPSAAAEEASLLCRLLRRLPSLGSGKTRGWGQIRLLEEPKKQNLPTGTDAGELPTGELLNLRLLLRNLEPLNLAATALAGNLIFGQSFIPGTRLRAALLHWLSVRDPILGEALADPERMLVGNAYATPGCSAESLGWIEVLPIPLSVEEPKGGVGEQSSSEAGAPLPWWALQGAGSDLLGERGERDQISYGLVDEKDEVETKRIKSEEYLVRSSGEKHWRRTRPLLGVLMRNQVPTVRREGRRNGRPEREEGLFSEQVLWEEQCFVADLLFVRRSDAVDFARRAVSLLQGELGDRSWLRIGRGGRPVRVEGCLWQSAKPVAHNPSQTDRLTLTLTSDLIARSPWLTFHTTLDMPILVELVRRAGKTPPGTDGITAGKASKSEAIEVYGFNTATGLLRAPALGIRRGGVLVLSTTEAARPRLQQWREILAELGVRGLGERTAEGFGRFVLDLDVHRPEYWKQDRPRTAVAPPAREPNWEEDVLEKVEQFLKDQSSHLLDPRGKNGPSVSQWQWLRAQAAVATNGTQLLDALTRLSEHAQRLAARTQWGTLPTALRNAVEEVGRGLGDEAVNRQKWFVESLVRAMVARLRQDRRRMKETNQ